MTGGMAQISVQFWPRSFGFSVSVQHQAERSRTNTVKVHSGCDDWNSSSQGNGEGAETLTAALLSGWHLWVFSRQE